MVDSVTTASAAAGTISSGTKSLASNFETFLSLLTTQLKNQDPLSPVDSNEFTAQLTQMAGVEQQLLTNTLLKSLLGGQQAGGLSDAAAYIGLARGTLDNPSTRHWQASPAAAACAGALGRISGRRRSAARMPSSSARANARSRMFSSSRTLPGHSMRLSRRSVSAGMLSMLRPRRRAILKVKAFTSRGISSDRSRRGGRWIGKTFSR